MLLFASSNTGKSRGICVGGGCTAALTTGWLAQLDKNRSAVRKVAGSNPGQTNIHGLL